LKTTARKSVKGASTSYVWHADVIFTYKSFDDYKKKNRWRIRLMKIGGLQSGASSRLQSKRDLRFASQIIFDIVRGEIVFK